MAVLVVFIEAKLLGKQLRGMSHKRAENAEKDKK